MVYRFLFGFATGFAAPIFADGPSYEFIRYCFVRPYKHYMDATGSMDPNAAIPIKFKLNLLI